MRGRLNQDDVENKKSLKNLSSEVLELLEQKIGSSLFIGVYSEVQQSLQQRKSEKKKKLAADAVNNPRAFAERKVMLY